MDLPEAQEQHVVEFVFTEGSGYSDEEGLSEQRRAGVVVARLFVLLPQVHRDHHVVCVLHPVHRNLKPADTCEVCFEVTLEKSAADVNVETCFYYIYIFVKQFKQLDWHLFQIDAMLLS